MELEQLGPLIYRKNSVLSLDECRELIERFEADDEKVQSVVGFAKQVDKKIRDTMEVYISERAKWRDADERIHKIISKAYIDLADKFPGLRSMKPGDQGYWILRYEPGAQYVPHCDWNSFSKRQLSFVLYLNDVKEGGGTAFPHFGLVVSPRAGDLLLFPPFWTHEHAGLPPVNERKYCLVTWVTL